MKKSSIKSFRLLKADYLVSDSLGNSVVLTVDYKNKFTDVVKPKGHLTGSAKLDEEAINIGKTLAERKSGVNFASKLIE